MFCIEAALASPSRRKKTRPRLLRRLPIEFAAANGWSAVRAAGAPGRKRIRAPLPEASASEEEKRIQMRRDELCIRSERRTPAFTFAR